MANIHYIESTTQNTLRFRFQFFAHAPPAQRRRQVLSRLGNFLCRNTRYCTGSAFRSILRGQCIQPSLFSPSLIVTLSSLNVQIVGRPNSQVFLAFTPPLCRPCAHPNSKFAHLRYAGTHILRSSRAGFRADQACR